MPPIRTATEPGAVAPLAVQPLLSVRDLRVSFDLDEGVVRAVDGASFDVFAGQTVGIVGESGCGKSVAMKAILQLIDRPGRIAGGEILFRRRIGRVGAETEEIVDLARLPSRGAAMRSIRGAEIALIPQEPMAAFSPVHSVGDQIIEALLLHWRQWRPDGPALSRKEARQITVDLFNDVGISMPDRRVDAYSWQLSGGLRQRAMIAMALLCEPDLLIADEPTTALDVTIQAQILELLRELRERRGLSILLITHDLGVVASTCDRVAVMYAGRIVEAAPVRALFKSPQHPYTRALLASIPNPGAADRERLRALPGLPPRLDRGPFTACSFLPRCQDAVAVCRAREPELRAPSEGRQVRCVRPVEELS